MCRLFGQISIKPKKIDYWIFDADVPFIEFAKKKINHGPHNSGWGIAYLKNKKWEIFKTGENGFKEEKLKIVKKIQSPIILFHLRKSSIGKNNEVNAHPFKYKNWVFGHNGGVDRNKILMELKPIYKEKIRGETDSEVFFLLIMQYYEQENKIVNAIKMALKFVKKYKYEGLNFILSDGERIYVFRDCNTSIKGDKEYYSLNYLKKKDEIIISSDLLTKDNWKSINLGELLVIDKSLKIKKISTQE